MSHLVDLTGRVFGKWRVISKRRWGGGETIWNVVCECGTHRSIRKGRLVNGESKSCGCANKVQDGMSDTPTGWTWQGIIHRCYSKKDSNYHRYGGRGIVVCDYLRKSPASLVKAIGIRPKGLTIERIDNDGDYSCGMCSQCRLKHWPLNIRWATMAEQALNRRSNHKVTYAGVTKTITEWAVNFGVNRATIYGRIRRGWEPELAITTPAT